MSMIVDDIEKAYAPKSQTTAPVEGKNQTIVNNIKDSSKGKDSTKK